MSNIANKVVLISGASSVISAAMAHVLAGNGDNGG